MASYFKLIIEDDEGKTTIFPLAGREILIGRKEGNTIRLMERNISRRHARVFRGEDGVVIEDLDSYNGIRVNGERVQGKRNVQEGDLVEIGDYHLALKETELPTADLEIFENTEKPHIEGQKFKVMDHSLSTLRSAAVSAPMLTSETIATEITEAEITGLSNESIHQKKQSVTPESLRSIENYTRIVCVSTEFAGLEFKLAQDERIIGRENDNDIIIDHRSVSRNHAKIIFEGSKHKVVDLQSANGVLVNGDEFAVTDLRSNDLIELGHVQLRFISANAEFIPTEAEIAAIKAAGRQFAKVSSRTHSHREAIPEIQMSEPPTPRATHPTENKQPELPERKIQDRDLENIRRNQKTQSDRPKPETRTSEGTAPMAFTKKNALPSLSASESPEIQRQTLKRKRMLIIVFMLIAIALLLGYGAPRILLILGGS